MEIIPINDSKKAKNKEKVFLEIILDAKNLMKIPVQIFYHKEQGFKNYLLTYDVEKFKVPFSTFIPKILPHLIKITLTHNLKIGFKGIPKQVFEKSILRPGLRWKFEEKFLFFGEDNIDPKYVEAFGESELKELETNKEFYPLNLERLEKFENEKLKNIGQEILKDFKKDKHHLRKRFVFVDSYPKTNQESSQERFVYYIYNRKDDFEKTYSLFEKYFDKSKIKKIKKFMESSEQLVISFAIMSNGKLRTTIYFTTHDLRTDETKELFKILGLELEIDKLWGIGIDSIDKSFNYKAYYEEATIGIADIKEYFKEFNLEKKRKLLRFLNSRTKPLKSVLLDKKIKDGKVFSKRVDVSLQYNSVKIHQLMSLFDIDLRGLADKDLYTISFELTHNEPEKINVYCASKMPEPIEEKEEQESYKRYRY